MTNDELVDRLVEDGRITSSRVEKAFKNVDRKGFVSDSSRAYVDRPLRIGENATISAPHMVAINTELLEVAEDSTVLEIGSGSGYQLAILSELTSEKVIGVEINRKLVEESRQRLESRAEVVHGNGLEAVEGGFDRILFSCGIDSLDCEERLEEDGIAVAPVKRRFGQVMQRLKNGETTEHGRVRFVECRT